MKWTLVIALTLLICGVCFANDAKKAQDSVVRLFIRYNPKL